MNVPALGIVNYSSFGDIGLENRTRNHTNNKTASILADRASAAEDRTLNTWEMAFKQACQGTKSDEAEPTRLRESVGLEVLCTKFIEP